MGRLSEGVFIDSYTEGFRQGFDRSIDESMDILEIPEDDQPRYREWLEEDTKKRKDVT